MIKHILRRLGIAVLSAVVGLTGLALLSFGRAAQSSADLQATPADGVDLQHLPLGDGKGSTSPRIGYLWSCQSQFNAQGGAGSDGPWINSDGTWDETAKLTVSGAVEWPDAAFTINVVGDERQIAGNGLPNHPTGVFPIQASDAVFRYDQNPSRISAQTIGYSLPVSPTLAATASCVPGMVGIAITGVPIFDAFDAEGRDAPAHEAQDSCGGHPQQFGQYHYHNLSACIEALVSSDAHSELIGYALDGFGIYGYHGENGQILTDADLDECHGHTHAIQWDGQTVVMYHYHATAEFPYTVGCFRGAPVMGGNLGQGNPGGAQNGPNGQGGPDLAAAAARLGITEQALRDALGPPPPDLAAAAARLGISEQALRDALGVPPPPGAGG